MVNITEILLSNQVKTKKQKNQKDELWEEKPGMLLMREGFVLFHSFSEYFLIPSRLLGLLETQRYPRKKARPPSQRAYNPTGRVSD